MLTVLALVLTHGCRLAGGELPAASAAEPGKVRNLAPTSKPGGKLEMLLLHVDRDADGALDGSYFEQSVSFDAFLPLGR
jgi:hypothetical protein